MEDETYEGGNEGWPVEYDGQLPPGFEDISMRPAAPIEPMTGSAAERPQWGVRPMQDPSSRAIPQRYVWPPGTDAVYRDMRMAGDDAPAAPSSLLPMILLALGAGGYLGWRYGGGPFGAAGGALLGAALVNGYRAIRSMNTDKQEAMTSGTWAVAGAAAALYLLYRARSEAHEGDLEDDEDDWEDEDDGDDDEDVSRYAPLPDQPAIVKGGYEPIDVHDEPYVDDEPDEPPPRRYVRNAEAVKMKANAAKASVQMQQETPVKVPQLTQGSDA